MKRQKSETSRRKYSENERRTNRYSPIRGEMWDTLLYEEGRIKSYDFLREAFQQAELNK
ncbi:hypothetical protein [Domibacillus mangrovi]|uniref:hypothetical protein n=1 Tax=Domibacillus mangrovi TaxID=1714354 RepID=UPI000ACE3C5F|nr:hypothetical protein [Domibacillus mangrovi]